MPIKLIVFDLAGTTVEDDFDVHRILQDAFRQHEIVISIEEANSVMGIPKPVAIQELLKKHADGRRPVEERWITQIHHSFIEGMIQFYQNSLSVREKDGVTETFQELKQRKLKIFVDTGFDRKITDVVLHRMGWLEANLLDGSVASDEVSFGRPYPDLVLRAMEMAGVSDADEVAKVGDTTSDLLEGFHARCKFVIGITTGAHSRETLQNYFHTHLIDNIREVVPIVSKQ